MFICERTLLTLLVVFCIDISYVTWLEPCSVESLRLSKIKTDCDNSCSVNVDDV